MTFPCMTLHHCGTYITIKAIALRSRQQFVETKNANFKCYPYISILARKLYVDCTSCLHPHYYFVACCAGLLHQ